MDNIIFLNFFKKTNFPKGKWLSEPDFCKWVSFNLNCLVFRDLSLGTWKACVAVPKTHLLFNKTIDKILEYDNTTELFYAVHGGISIAGLLPQRYGSYNKDSWWIGIETSHGGDLLPLVHLEHNNPYYMVNSQSYKDFFFIRRETKKLAKILSQIK